MIIHGYTVSALGRLADTREHNTTQVPRRAVEGANRLLGVNGREFVARLGMKGLENVELHWKSTDFSAALVTFAEDNDLLSTEVIVSGIRPEADRQALEAAQVMLRSVCETVGETAAEDLLRASAAAGRGLHPLGHAGAQSHAPGEGHGDLLCDGLPGAGFCQRQAHALSAQRNQASQAAPTARLRTVSGMPTRQ